MGKPSDLIQGTLDLLILKTLAVEPKHGWAIAKRIQQVSDEVLPAEIYGRCDPPDITIRRFSTGADVDSRRADSKS